jgi:predicted dehydrogenase
MANPLRVGMVGIGWWSGVLADSIHGKSDQIKVVSCFTRDEGKRGTFAAKYGIRQAKTYDELLKDSEVEGVVLCTPHTLHAEHTIAAAQAGKHVFVEKPYTLKAADGIKGAAACRKAGVVLAVGHSRRRQPTNRKLKAMLEAKELGTVAQAECNLSAGAVMGYKPGLWRASRVESPAGAMTGMGVHHVDTLQYLLGPVARVMAMSKRIAAPVDLEDATVIALEFERGPVGLLGTAFCIPKVLYLNVYGTEANVYTEGEGAKLFVQKKGTEEKVPVPMQPVDILREELEDFARAARGQGTYDVTPDDAIRVVAVLEAVGRSAETGRAVDVKDFLA